MFKNLGKDLVKAFNTGVSYFLPAVVIGGVFLAFALATGEAGSDGMKVTNGFMQNINTIGSAGMAMMIHRIFTRRKACACPGYDCGLYSK